VTGTVGILGGTFDPVHNAHLAIARLALERLAGRVLWMPTGAPAYRQPPVAPARDRLAMLKLATAGEARYAIDERELRPAASGFTFDSISSLQGENRQKYVLIMARTSMKALPWHRWNELRNSARSPWSHDRVADSARVRSLPMTPMASRRAISARASGAAKTFRTRCHRRCSVHTRKGTLPLMDIRKSSRPWSKRWRRQGPRHRCVQRRPPEPYFERVVIASGESNRR
jgi:cytidyltransferase-like protein